MFATVSPIRVPLRRWNARCCTMETIRTQYASARSISTMHQKMYDTHERKSALEKLGMSVGSSILALSDPSRDDMIAILGETTGRCALQQMYSKMMQDPDGREILRLKPSITEASVNFSRLRTLPASTFGGAYTRFMDHHGFTPDKRAPVRYVDDPELAYVMKRYREVHDFWHVLSGMDTTVLGEISLKWFEFLQTGLPMAAIGGLGGPLRLSFSDQYTLATHGIPWAIKCNNNCKWLLNVKYEEHFDDDLNDFRRYLNFVPFRG